nr:hypothetical protein HmN_000953900 [Hymenolepis microstoma]
MGDEAAEELDALLIMDFTTGGWFAFASRTENLVPISKPAPQLHRRTGGPLERKHKRKSRRQVFVYLQRGVELSNKVEHPVGYRKKELVRVDKVRKTLTNE